MSVPTTTTTTTTFTERVFIVGGTGSVGSKTVKDLLANKVAVTLYARDPSKVAKMFPAAAGSDLLRVVQGDFNDLSPLEEAVKGHSRLYLIASDFDAYVQVKKTIATSAYAAGVKQIVDVSSSNINYGWRTTAIGQMSYLSEKAVFDVPNRGYMVTLRPIKFMGNLLRQVKAYVQGGVFNNVPQDFRQGWISNNDIGAMAAVILQEDIHKHGDAVYNMTGDIRTPAEFTQFLSKIVGKDLPYKQLTDVQMYNGIMQSGYFSHPVALELIDYAIETSPKITPCIEIILGRKPETLEEFLNANKEHII